MTPKEKTIKSGADGALPLRWNRFPMFSMTDTVCSTRCFLVLCTTIVLAISHGDSLAGEASPTEVLGTIESVVTTPMAMDDQPGRPDGLGLSPENDLLQARQRAISLAGAFANDGYRLRDGSWSLYLSENQPALMAIWLFARNGVWFSAATADKGASPHLEIFSPEGTALPALRHQGPGVAAAGFLAPVTGKYFIRASFPGPLTPFCLVTSYK